MKIKNIYQKIIYQIKMLKHRPKLFWDKLYIREDEFHKSLDMNINAMLDMSKEEQYEYLSNLNSRRQKAHLKDFQK
jgi:hypothetical protein